MVVVSNGFYEGKCYETVKRVLIFDELILLGMCWSDGGLDGGCRKMLTWYDLVRDSSPFFGTDFRKVSSGARKGVSWEGYRLLTNTLPG